MKLSHILFVIAPVLLTLTDELRSDSSEREPEAAIEAAYREYAQDFIGADFEGIASHFRLPVMFEVRTPRILQTKEELVRAYRDVRLNIQDGYAYSTVDSIDIQRITEQIYSADVTYSRFNAADEVIHRGRTVYLYREVEGAWKMFLLAPYSTQ